MLVARMPQPQYDNVGGDDFARQFVLTHQQTPHLARFERRQPFADTRVGGQRAGRRRQRFDDARRRARQRVNRIQSQ